MIVSSHFFAIYAQFDPK